jgi:FtsH-binding integral membrane protein
MTKFESSLGWTQASELSKTAKFMSRVYGWMMLGVGMSGIVAYVISENTSLSMAIVQNPIAMWGMIILQFALVIGLSRSMNRLNAVTMGFLYFVYAAVTGVLFSTLFLIYAQDSIFSMFFLTAFAFAGLSATGYLTKKDLGPIGSFCIMGVWGMIGFSIVALFFPSFRGGQASMLTIHKKSKRSISVALTAKKQTAN